MLSPEEILEFRMKMLRTGIKMKWFCRDRNMDYNRFAQEITGHARLQEKHEKQVREYIEQ